MIRFATELSNITTQEFSNYVRVIRYQIINSLMILFQHT